MPTYEYKCDYCNYELEAFQSIAAKPLKKCPECGKATLKRLLGTGAGLIFKGSGFTRPTIAPKVIKKLPKVKSPLPRQPRRILRPNQNLKIKALRRKRQKNNTAADTGTSIFKNRIAVSRERFI